MSNPNKLVTIKLLSSDGMEFEVPVEVALLSKPLHSIIQTYENDEDGDNGEEFINLAEEPVFIHNINSQVLAKVIEFCEHHVQTEDKMTEIELPLEGETLASNGVSEWYIHYCYIHLKMLEDLVQAAKHLNIPLLIDLAALAYAIRMERWGGIYGYSMW